MPSRLMSERIKMHFETVQPRPTDQINDDIYLASVVLQSKGLMVRGSKFCLI